MNPTRRLPDIVLAPPSRGQPTPAFGHPSEEGTPSHPLLGGKEETCLQENRQMLTRFLFVPRKRRGGFLFHQVKRWLACRRGSAALENALATIPLVLCLVGMFEIVQTIFAGDLVKRAAYRVARANALAAAPASTKADMANRITQAIDTEVGGWLDYDLRMGTDCPDPSTSNQNQTADYCVSAKIEVYSSPGGIMNGQQAVQDDTAGYGGGTGDTVVIRLHVKPQSASSGLKKTLFGETGPQFRSVAVMRNEERIP